MIKNYSKLYTNITSSFWQICPWSKSANNVKTSQIEGKKNKNISVLYFTLIVIAVSKIRTCWSYTLNFLLYFLSWYKCFIPTIYQILYCRSKGLKKHKMFSAILTNQERFFTFNFKLQISNWCFQKCEYKTSEVLTLQNLMLEVRNECYMVHGTFLFRGVSRKRGVVSGVVEC